ncbi:hypothetical protein EAH79_10390 [Sphingomonas koreensis]|nr:hypothetical protein EAH79_10390 [Sphingomonas koreensis]
MTDAQPQVQDLTIRCDAAPVMDAPTVGLIEPEPTSLGMVSTGAVRSASISRGPRIAVVTMLSIALMGVSLWLVGRRGDAAPIGNAPKHAMPPAEPPRAAATPRTKRLLPPAAPPLVATVENPKPANTQAAAMVSSSPKQSSTKSASGAIAVPLYGEALRLALIEDRKQTQAANLVQSASSVAIGADSATGPPSPQR